MNTHLTFTLSPKQFAKTVKRNGQRLLRTFPAYWPIQFLSFAMVAGMTATLLLTHALTQGQYADAAKPAWITALSTLIAFFLYTLFYQRGLRQALLRSTHHTNIETNLAIEGAGLRTQSAHGESFTPWSALIGVEEVDDVLLLLLDNVYYIPIPANAFASTHEKDAFIAHIRQAIQGTATLWPSPLAEPVAAPVAAPVSADSAPSRTTRPKALAKTLLVSLGQALKLAFFLPVPEQRIHVSWWQIPIFALLSLLLPFVWSFIKLGFGGVFQWYSLPLALFHLPALLLAAIFIAYALRRADKTLLLLQVFLMIGLALDVILLAISSLFRLPPTAFSAQFLSFPYFSLPALWLALACLKAASGFTLTTLPRRTLAAAITLALIALPLGVIYRQYDLWSPPYDESASNPMNFGLANEDNFYSQQKLLERELAALQAERKGVTDVYLIGMAGYGEQDVFMKEVDAVARLFRERFDAEGRTIRLVNNNKTLASSPIASATSLKAALHRVAKTMNKEEDVLFLFLTSHGSEKHHFALELWPLNFNPLDPARLRKMLDESGIKHRVVVVSACYSGGFINALKNDHTLVITASAPDKNSFGCSNENDWTYFGQAYFNEALRSTYSFTEAFDLAKPLITARETKQKFTPSNPQMALGNAMRDKLALLAQQYAQHKPIDHSSEVQATTTFPDKFEQYANLVYDYSIAAQDHEACIASMQSNGPDATVEVNPNYFAGLNKTSTQWPQLVNAWNRYAESYCAKANDAEAIRSLFISHLRANVPMQDLAPVLKFLTSENGKRWYPNERQVTRKMYAELTRIQRELDVKLSKIYQDELTRIYDAFVAENNARNKAVK
jgi:hypothetical protein